MRRVMMVGALLAMTAIGLAGCAGRYSDAPPQGYSTGGFAVPGF